MAIASERVRSNKPLTASQIELVCIVLETDAGVSGHSRQLRALFSFNLSISIRFWYFGFNLISLM